MEEFLDVGRGVTLCYERHGDPTNPPLVLIMGLGQQLLAWPNPFCEGLIERGFEVIRFDNRDIGRSWHSTGRAPTLPQLLTRRFAPDQYTISDMARDTAGLIDGLGRGPAHVVGISLGGMIAQMVAAEHPRRVRSLVSIMSTTGARGAGWVAPRVLPSLFGAPARDEEQAADRAVRMWRMIGSHRFAFDEASARDRARRAFHRDRRAPAGTGRQMAAILKSGDRTEALRAVTAPTLVIHGDRDRMVHPSGGRATARAIPGARLETIPGLGHDLPAGAFPRLIELIADHCTTADRGGHTLATA